MAKSSHHKSKKRKRSRSLTDDAANSLHSLLSQGVLKHPDFLQDFTQIVASLDQGKSVSVEGVESEELKRLYETILVSMPLVNHNGQWAKQDAKKPLNRVILSHLLSCKCIKQPRQLSHTETWSVRIAKQILQVFSTVPQLQSEFRYLLQKLVDGEEVDMSGIDNYEIKLCLERFFEPLELDTEYKDVYALSSEKKELKYALNLVIPFLELPQVPMNDSDGDDCASSSGSSSESDGVEQPDSHNTSGVIGPAMPSREQLMMAAQQAQLHNSVGSDDDDDFGPSLPSGDDIITYAPRLPVRTAQTQGPGDTSGREEWMLTPGQSNAFEVQALSGTAVSRKFQHGKEARKSAEVLQAQRDAEEEAYRNSEEGKRTQALLDEYREKRGPSLMEMHHISGVKRPDAKSRGFNREEDMSMHRKLSKQEAEAMVEQSKTLDSRFNRSIEKSFL